MCDVCPNRTLIAKNRYRRKFNFRGDDIFFSIFNASGFGHILSENANKWNVTTILPVYENQKLLWKGDKIRF